MLKSNEQKVHLSIFLLGSLVLVLMLSACQRYIPVIPDVPQCSTFIPEDWWTETPGVDLPADNAAGTWVAALNGQTGQLEVANLKVSGIKHVITTCEATFQKAIEKAEKQARPWWQRL